MEEIEEIQVGLEVEKAELERKIDEIRRNMKYYAKKTEENCGSSEMKQSDDENGR